MEYLPQILHGFITIIGLLILFSEVVTYFIFGFYIRPSTCDKLSHIKKENFRLFNGNMLMPVNSSGSGFYISKLPIMITSKYQVNGYGIVWRWSKLHRIIDNIYNEFKKEKIERVLNNERFL